MREKGPVERFFRTLREDLLQALPGYKGPDVHSRGPDLASEFLKTELRTIQHYGVETGGRRYNGRALNGYRNATSPYPGTNGLWPIQVDPDDVTHVYFRDPRTRRWHTLDWEHAPSLE